MSKRRESQHRYNQKTYRMLIKISPNDPDTLKAWQEHRAKFDNNQSAFRALLK